MGGFQFLLILDLWGISFYAVVVFGLGKNLLFKSVLGHCVQKGRSEDYKAVLDRNGGSNGHTSEHNRSSTENRDHGNESSGDEGEGQIRVGKDYQISPPDWIPPERKSSFIL